jgi:hypothetical protein
MKKKFQTKTKQMTAMMLAFAMSIQLAACGSVDTSGGLADEPGQTDAWFWIFIAIVRICIFSLVASYLLFRKKKLDF